MHYQIDDVFLPNNSSSFWSSLKGVFNNLFKYGNGKEKNFVMMRYTIFEALYNICMKGILPIAPKGSTNNMLFMKSLLRNFFRASKESHHGTIFLWEKVRPTTYYEVIIIPWLNLWTILFVLVIVWL